MRHLSTGPDDPGVPRAADQPDAWPRWTRIRGQVCVYERLPADSGVGGYVASLWAPGEDDTLAPVALFGPQPTPSLLQSEIIRRIVHGVR